MNSTIYDITLLFNACGVGISMFWSYLLLTRKSPSIQNLVLASLLILFAAFMVNTLMHLSGYGAYISSYQQIMNGLTYLLGPLILSFVYSYTRPKGEWVSSFWYHFIPFAVISPLFLLFESTVLNHNLGTFLISLWNVQMLIYLIVGIKELYKVRAMNTLAASIIFYFTPVWIINLTLFIIKTFWFPIPEEIYLNVTLLFCLPIMMIAFRTLGLMQDSHSSKNRFKLSNSSYTDYSLKLTSAMRENQLYKDPDLAIVDLARSTQIPSRYVSATLNHQMNQSFHEFVNHYRVDEVIRRIKAGDSDARTLIAIAQESGFKSPSAFYKAFRSCTGTTPGLFRKNLDESM